MTGEQFRADQVRHMAHGEPFGSKRIVFGMARRFSDPLPAMENGATVILPPPPEEILRACSCVHKQAPPMEAE